MEFAVLVKEKVKHGGLHKTHSQHKIKLKRLPQIIFKHVIVKFYVRCYMQGAKRDTTHSERYLSEFG